MELTLTGGQGTQVAVACDGQPSHTFDLLSLVPDPHMEGRPPHPLEDPQAYGQALFRALFPPGTPAAQALSGPPGRILFVTAGAQVHMLPWEYLYGPHGFLVLDWLFVRALPPEQRIDAPSAPGKLHIVAVPANPLSKQVEPLNIEGEWLRLQEAIDAAGSAVTLERARPPSLEQLSTLLAGRQGCVVHFMGHGGQADDGAALLFEQTDGRLDAVSARNFVRSVRGAAFLVTLNACASATPGPAPFSNAAAALAACQTPYALGMQFNVRDADALTLARTFYTHLVRGVPVEEALRHSRLALSRSQDVSAIGVPVLYTALKAPAPGFTPAAGAPTVIDLRPPMDVDALPRAEGAFQGRSQELVAIGQALTGDNRPRILTLHGAGGQGKTALAREAVERFAFAWPGGVWAVSLETLPSRQLFSAGLARFLGLDPQQATDSAALERQILARLAARRTLLVIDNAETLVTSVEGEDAAALALSDFMQRLPGPRLSLLVTSRRHLEWPGEVGIDLGGLQPDEGAALFCQSAPQRSAEVEGPQAEALSRLVEGHPLSLRLLGGAFNTTPSLSMAAFVQGYEQQLAAAENKYLGPEHRHRTLYAAIDTSVRYLAPALRDLFSGLWIFQAPFLAQTAAAVFDPDGKYPEGQQSPVYDQLYALWLRGLLERSRHTLRDGTVELYRLLPVMRPYIETTMPQAHPREALLRRFAAACARLVRYLYRELDRSAAAVYIAQQAGQDLARAGAFLEGEEQGYYLLRWGRIAYRLGDARQGLRCSEQALALAEGQYAQLQLQALNNLAGVYQGLGQPQRALGLYEQALPIRREVGDRAGEAATLSNMAGVYQRLGQAQQALGLYEQALPIQREVGDRAGEATTLNNMAGVYQGLGQAQRALGLYQQALPIQREVGDRAGEATTLNNMAGVYQGLGQAQRALGLYQQALPIQREVGDRAGEATTLNNMATIYFQRGETQRTADLLRQVIQIDREIQNAAGVAGDSFNLAGVLHRGLGQTAEAISLTRQAIAILQQYNLPQADTGITIAQMEAFLAQMQSGASPPAPPSEPVGVAAEVMQAVQAFVGAADLPALRLAVEAGQALLFRPEVEALFESNIARARQDGKEEWAGKLDFYLTLLRACKHQGIAAAFAGLPAAAQAAEPQPQPVEPQPQPAGVPGDFVARCAAGLQGPLELKPQTFEYLQALRGADAGLDALISTVQQGLWGSPLATLGADLPQPYAAVWRQIVQQVATGGQP